MYYSAFISLTLVFSDDENIFLEATATVVGFLFVWVKWPWAHLQVLFESYFGETECEQASHAIVAFRVKIAQIQLKKKRM